MCADAVVLSGGNDIGEFLHRDKTERLVMQHARNKRLPLLGICRGMQIMAVDDGASLEPVQHHIATKHQLKGEINHRVNSYHALRISRCPKSYNVIAWAEDGTIEAIKHKFLPWEGWMWHPERELFFDENDLHRLKALL